MTFAVLRALHAIIGDALDDIQRIYDPRFGPMDNPKGSDGHPCESRPPIIESQNPRTAPYASPPLSPLNPSSSTAYDFPSLDVPYDPRDPAEQLTAHPTVVVAINKIVSAAGQIAATVQTPFLSLCDASMGYHLTACLRLLEASHAVELLREAGPDGLHVRLLSERTGVENTKLAHILRLLATHHIIRERIPNVFTINRISALIDSNHSFAQLTEWDKEGRSEMKYHDTDGIAAFVGLNADELYKASGYLTEACLSLSEKPSVTPFELAFEAPAGFFAWLEGDGSPEKKDGDKSVMAHTARGANEPNPNRFRLERFGKAMSGTVSWEAPGAVLNGFDWHMLPRGSIIVDVGGGIGSTSMVLANAFSRSRDPPSSTPDGGDAGEGTDLGLQFIIQDREVVVELGEKAWRASCPELLDSGTARFQVHDFFTAQPIRNAAVFFLRVVLHDWPDVLARKILLKLREAATNETKLVLADFVLPLACADVPTDSEDGDDIREMDTIEGAESILAPAPLLPNLGKASAGAYWMDMTMQAIFNSQERTLREIAALTLSAGWKVVKVTKAVGSLFGHIVAIPTTIPVQSRARAGSGSAFLNVPRSANSKAASVNVRAKIHDEKEGMERASSRCGTPTFGSRMNLPSVQETMARFGGGGARPRNQGRLQMRGGPLKQAVVLTAPPVKKKKPSPLSFIPQHTSLSSSPISPKQLGSPREPQLPPAVTRRMSFATLNRPQSQSGLVPPLLRQPPPSPLSPRYPQPRALARRASVAHLVQNSQAYTHPTNLPPSPSLSKQCSLPSPQPALSRRSSYAQLSQYQHGPSVAPSFQARGQELSQSPTAVPLRHPPCLPHPSTSPIAPKVTPRTHAPITRRSSYAQLPNPTLRKRSDSIVGPPASGGIGGEISMGSLLSGGGGGALNFYQNERGRTTPVPSGGAGSVLAAAARIERGITQMKPSP